MPVLVVTGSYSFIGPDGVTYFVKYESDEKGYRAEGAHLPETGSSGTDIFPAPPPQALPPNIALSLLG